MNLVPVQTKITGSIMTPLGFYDTKRLLYLSPDLGKFLVPGLISIHTLFISTDEFIKHLVIIDPGIGYSCFPIAACENQLDGN